MFQNVQSVGLQNQLRRKWARVTERATHYLSAFAWRANGALARGAGKLQGLQSADSLAFVKVPLTHGRISAPTLDQLKAAILNAPEADFRVDDHAPGYVFNGGGDELKRIFNAGYHFRRLDDAQNRAIAAAIDEIAPQITRKLGSGWRVINIKSWSIRSNTVAAGPNAWHVDGFPPSTYKLMVYLTPVGKETGTTEVRYDDGSTDLIEGEAGTYLLFDPSTLWHRGLSPTVPDYERTHIEITLMRAPYMDATPVYGGLNSSYPRMPWTARPSHN